MLCSNGAAGNDSRASFTAAVVAIVAMRVGNPRLSCLVLVLRDVLRRFHTWQCHGVFFHRLLLLVAIVAMLLGNRRLSCLALVLRAFFRRLRTWPCHGVFFDKRAL